MAPKPLRVLWLTKGLGPGGAERLLVAQAAVTDPAQVHYEAAYLLPFKRHLVGDLEALGVTTHLLDAPRARDLGWVPRLRRLLEARDFDVVHAHSPVPAASARLVVRSMPRRQRPVFVSTEHNLWPSHRPATRAANAVTFPLNDAAIAVSEEVRRSMAAPFRADTQVIVHGIDVEGVRALALRRDSMRAELDIGDDDVLVVTVANLRASKGLFDLLEAARLVTDRDRRVRFVLIGQGPLEGELRARHGELGLGDAFRILGYRPDAAAITAAADLFVLASHHEGLPVAVMEAQAAGVPVVATDVGGLAEAVQEGESGRLVPAHRPDRLAQAIEALIADPAERARLGQGAALSSARFSSARSAAEIEALYRATLLRAAVPR